MSGASTGKQQLEVAEVDVVAQRKVSVHVSIQYVGVCVCLCAYLKGMGDESFIINIP